MLQLPVQINVGTKKRFFRSIIEDRQQQHLCRIFEQS